MTTGKFDDGGPAYPVAEDHRVAHDLPWTCGMTLADEFAKASMQLAVDRCASMEMSTVCAKLGIDAIDYNSDVHWPALVARQAFDFGAAMVAEKRRREGGGT